VFAKSFEGEKSAKLFVGDKFAKFNKWNMLYESLEKRQSKHNQLRLTTQVLEAAQLVKKGVVVYHELINFPAKKICLDERWHMVRQGSTIKQSTSSTSLAPM
jgi:hypothetical protein